MRVWYYPDALSVNEIELTFAINYLVKESRIFYAAEHKRIRTIKVRRQTDWGIPMTLCAVCGYKKKGRLEAHHRRPLWGFALVEILSKKIKKREELFNICSSSVLPPQSYAEDNLTVVCKRCHEEMEKECYAFWKDAFMKKYPLAFGSLRKREYSRLIEHSPRVPLADFLEVWGGFIGGQ